MDKTVQVLGACRRRPGRGLQGRRARIVQLRAGLRRRITLGDSPAYFNATLAQSGARTGQAQSQRRNRTECARLRQVAIAPRPAAIMVSDRLNAIAAVLRNARKNSTTRICYELVTVFRHRLASRRLPCSRASETRSAAGMHRLLPRARRAPLCAAARRRRRRRIRAGRGAVSGADLRHHGNGAGVLRRADAGSRRRRCGRLIMTGQAQTAGFSQADFKNQVVRAPLRRSVRLHERRLCRRQDLYQLQPAINTTPPVINGQFDTTNMNYTPGRPGCIVVRVALLPMADLRVAARRQSVQSDRRQSAAGGDVGLPQRALPMSSASCMR